MPAVPDKISLLKLTFDAGLAEPGHAVAFFPLAAFLQDFDALEALQHVALST